MANTDYSVTIAPALCRLYIHDGLMTTLKEAYEDLQDALACNCEVLRDVLIRKPGLRTTSEAFTSRVHGNYLYITLGHAVFIDHSIFIAPPGNQVVKMELPNPDDVIVNTLYAVLSHEVIDSHPYDKKAAMGVTTSVNVVTRDTAKIEILDSVGSDSLVICELARSQGGWVHTNVSVLYRLEVTSSRISEDFTHGVIADFVARSYCVSQLKPMSYMLDGISTPVDHEGNVANEAVGTVISCSWGALRPDVAGRKGNIAYYQVRAVPRNSEGTADPRQTISTTVFHHYETDGPTVRASLPCANGTIYDISLYELDDTLSQIVNGPVATGVAIGGVYDATLATATFPVLTTTITQPFAAKNVLKIRPILSGGGAGPYVCQVFVREYTVEPTPPPTTIVDRGCLIYEGPAMPIYHIIDPENGYAVVETRVIRWRGNELSYVDSTKTMIQTGSTGSSASGGDEVVLSVAVTNVIPDSAAQSTTVATWTNTPSFNLSRIACSMPEGCNEDGEKMCGNTGGVDWLIPDGGTIKLVGDGGDITDAELTFTATGQALVAFDPMVHVSAQNNLSLVIEHDTEPCLPWLMQVTLYIDDSWGWS